MSAKENKQLVDDMYQGLNENVLGVMHRYWKEDMVLGRSGGHWHDERT
jgi:hypothetical protein